MSDGVAWRVRGFWEETDDIAGGYADTVQVVGLTEKLRDEALVGRERALHRDGVGGDGHL